MSSVADLAIRLMAIDSTSGREHQVIAEAERMLASRGWATTLIDVTPDGRQSVLAMSADDVDVTLTTHLDTVPPFIPPRLTGDVLFGRGACDAKGIAASMILAGERLRDRGVKVALLFVIGEETCHDGAHAANAWVVANLPHRPRVFINGEPTDSTLGVGTKGAQRVAVRTKGKAAHSAYPAMGHSATLDLVRLLAELEGIQWPSDELLGETTVNIGSLSGGVADNVFAPSAEARLMFRLVTPAAVIHDQVEAWVKGRAELEWGIMVPPVRLGTVDGFPTSVPAFATDVPALTNWGTPFLFGPGSVHVAHTDEEHVRVSELESAVDAYEQIAMRAIRSG
ncbi:MAG: M20/M25/M40 family metallo-hydrolase [Cytophagaceae bacterium]|nr:M20/M25/M40 family metallo-hydrolase [Gemmatimonadaceae bacterium]